MEPSLDRENSLSSSSMERVQEEMIAHPFGARMGLDPIPRHSIPEKSIAPRHAYQLVHDELMLDGNRYFSLFIRFETLISAFVKLMIL